jgi:3-hydroxymyristoyl/3-hydroxydecanoyl-(acyl carrier protein) dehydratase
MTPAIEAGSFTIPPDHPSLAGHFPDDPIVPGVVLLDSAIALIGARLANGPMPTLRMAKFLAVVRPGQTVSVRFAPQGSGIGFVCAVADTLVLRGRLG